jgi:ABC-2 type transport system permease protein
MVVEQTAVDESPREAAPVPYESLGRPIHGPGALTDDWARFWHLTFNIAVMQWKMRFFGSVLGYVWQLVRPLLLFAVLYVFFVVIEQVGKGSDPSYRFYGSQLLASIVLFTFFGESTGMAVRSVVDNEALVRKIQFPRMVIPLSVVLLSLFNLSLNLLVVTAFALIEGVRPMWTWFEVPLLVVMLALLCTGIAMLLSSAFVYFRDIQPIWEVVNQVIFYASPIIIPVVAVQQRLSDALFHAYMLNPLAVIFQQFRHAFITHDTPSAGALLGSATALLEPTAIILAILVWGFVVFNRVAPRVAEDL